MWRKMTMLTIILLTLAVAMDFRAGWKVVVILAAVADLVMIGWNVWKSLSE